MTATRASPGPSSGTGTSSRCSDLRGSLSRVGRPANISTSSLCTVTARYDSGRGRFSKSAGVLSDARIASRISFTWASGERVKTLEGSLGSVCFSLSCWCRRFGGGAAARRGSAEGL